MHFCGRVGVGVYSAEGRREISRWHRGVGSLFAAISVRMKHWSGVIAQRAQRDFNGA